MTYEYDKKHGVYKRFYKNGKINIEGTHKFDKREGQESHFNIDGSLAKRLKFKKGNLKGRSNGDIVQIPNGLLSKSPIYPGCEIKVTNKELKKCMSERISEFVNNKFNINIAKGLGLVGLQRISVIFEIDTVGLVTDVRSRASHPDLEAEAIRVISLLPKMEPGMQHGKAVTVPYALPIHLIVPSKKNKSITEDPFFKN